MIRLVPEFWKLNSSGCGTISSLCLQIADVLWWEAYHECGTCTLNTIYQAKYLFFLIMLHPVQLLRKIQNVYNTQIWSSSTLTLKEEKSWDVYFEPDSTVHCLTTNHSVCLRSSTCVCSSLWNWLCPLWRCLVCHHLKQKIHLELVQLIFTVLKLF